MTGIYTYWDCPERRERIKTLDEVLEGSDWRSGLCPNTCPLSPRNSDYSECQHPSIIGHEPPKIKACRLGGKEITGHMPFRAPIFWCEGIIAMGKCPHGYAR